MAELRGDDVLQRVPELVLRLDATGSVRVDLADGPVLLGPGALDLLTVLAAPHTPEQALAAVPVNGVQAWLDRSSTLVQLVSLGVVRRQGADPGPVRATGLSTYSFDAHYTHTRMLDDVDRTQAFLSGVRAAVRPGDVVVDIGTGTGILAVAAALAGARKVYAVEAGGVADLAQAVIEGNGVADRVEVVRGWSTDVELPERVDVVVSETIGSEPLDERLLEIMDDARLRHAKPGARFVPQGLQIWGTVAQLPEETLLTFSSAPVSRWSGAYDVDLSPLLAWEGRVAQTKYSRKEVRRWTPLTEPALLADLRLDALDGLRVHQRARVPVTRAGRVGAGYLHFTTDLGHGVALSTAPGAATDSSWLHTAWLVAPWAVAEGDAVALEYGYRTGDRDGLAIGVDAG